MRLHKIAAIFIAACALGAFTSCKENSASSGKLQCYAGILPIKYFVEQVGGPFVHVEALVAPGQNPHTFEPTPKQIAGVVAAKVYFEAKWPFEEQMVEKIRRMSPDLKIVDINEGITMRYFTAEDANADGGGHSGHHDEHAGEPDPHVWLSPKNAKIICANICAALKQVDPAHAADYDKNLAAFDAKLDEVDKKVAAVLAPFKGRNFMVFHPAFGYFGDAYGLKQIPVEIEGKEPSAKQLVEFITKATQMDVKIIFVQPQFAPRSAEAIAMAIGGVVVPMDDLPADYLKNMQDMAEKLEKALKGTR